MNERIFKGTITELIHIGTNAFGVRTYRVGFDKGKALFQISQKKVMPISEGDKVLFTGSFISEKIFMIENIKDVTTAERQPEDKHLSEQNYRRKIIRQ